MLSSLETRRAWVTQRLANRFPPWAKVRKLSQSVGQQILEPMSRDLEDSYWWTNYNLGNTILNTTDINQISGLSRLDLPPTFDWRTTQHAESVIYLTPTSVRGETDSGWITLSQATNNSLEEFWYGVPDRITYTGESYSYLPVLQNTLVSNLATASPVSPSVAGKLWITLSNNGASIKNYKGAIARSSVTISGRDIHGREAEEKLSFAFNGTMHTKLAWSEVGSVATNYVDESASVRVDWLNIAPSEFLDPSGLHVTKDREKFRFWSLGSKSWGSTLNHMVFSADDLVLVEEGQDSKHAEYEIELLDTFGSNITALSLSPWPKRRWVIVSDGSSLHFFVPDIRMEPVDRIVEATTEAVVQIDLDKEWSYKGDTITLDYIMKRPFIRVLRTRWSVLKPDGTKVCIAPDGSEIAYSSSGWVNHPEGTIFKRVGFQGDFIDYEISDRGAYVFYLESIITDILTTEGQTRPTTHVDVRVLHSSYDTAQASLALPVSIGIGSSICFDGFHRPWIISNTGIAHLLQFHHDTYIADFQNKAIIVRDEYNNLEVEA